jgi:lipopolysaccharide transport system ATP-binding protein
LPDPAITIRTPLTIEFEYWNPIPGAFLDISFQLINDQGAVVFNPTTFLEPTWHGLPCPRGLFRSECQIPGDLLNDGWYNIDLVVAKNDCNVLFKMKDVLFFEVADDKSMRGNWHGKWPGAVRPNLPWITTLLTDELPEMGRRALATDKSNGSAG